MSAEKKQRLLYILLPAVLVIWGLIFQRIWAAVDEPVDATRDAAPHQQLAGRNITRRPPALLLSYADPFRPGKIAEPSITQPSSALSSVSARIKPSSLNLPVPPTSITVAPVTWPAIKYLGSIKNSRRNTCVALLAIDNDEAMVKPGDSYRNVKVSQIFRDSVQLLFQGQRKTLSRSES